jgi:hypothetical protein
MDHDLFLRQPVHRRARGRGRSLLNLLAGKLVEATGGDMARTGFAILWASAFLSAIVDNIPFVATMIPLIKSMAPAWRAGQDRAALVVPVPRRQRHADRCVGQPDGGGDRRTQRRPVPVRDLCPLWHADDGGLDRHRSCLRVVALFLSGQFFKSHGRIAAPRRRRRGGFLQWNEWLATLATVTGRLLFAS